MRSILVLAAILSVSFGFQLTHPIQRPRLLDPFNSLDFWSPFSRAINKQWNTGLRPSQPSTPEITETDTAYYITLDTAGYTKEELDIHVVGREVSSFSFKCVY